MWFFTFIAFENDVKIRSIIVWRQSLLCGLAIRNKCITKFEFIFVVFVHLLLSQLSPFIEDCCDQINQWNNRVFFTLFTNIRRCKKQSKFERIWIWRMAHATECNETTQNSRHTNILSDKIVTTRNNEMNVRFVCFCVRKGELNESQRTNTPESSNVTICTYVQFQFFVFFQLFIYVSLHLGT